MRIWNEMKKFTGIKAAKEVKENKYKKDDK